MGLHCPVTGVNIPRFLITVIAAFGFIFGFEFAYHGILLKPAYEATMHLWRPEADIIALMPYSFAVQLSMAVLITGLFAFTKRTGLKNGLRFGVILGLLLGILQLSAYTYLPIPLELATAWFSGAFFETLGVALLAGLIYKP